MSPNIDLVVTTLKSLHQFDSTVDSLFAIFDEILLKPRLAFGNTVSTVQIVVDHRTIRTSGRETSLGLKDLFGNLHLLVDFINTSLPSSVAMPLSDRLIPRLITSLTSTWLPSALPFGLTEMNEFQNVLELVRHFAQHLDSIGWDGKEDLDEWIDLAPRNWLTKQREVLLANTRQELSRGLGFKSVERVETQKISRQENMFTGAQEGDNWDAGWSDDDDEQEKGHDRGEDDTTAWGFEDESQEAAGEEDHDDGAWGWGDEDDHSQSRAPKSPKRKDASVNGHGPRGEVEREVTLRETYSITTLPEAIIAIIRRILSDADTLASPASTNSPVLPALSGLFLLPTLVLAMYRAAAPMHYSKNPTGSMYLYNDSLWLAQELRTITSTREATRQGTRPTHKLKLENDIESLEVFGRRAYSREMETQRTILGDLLDGAQGFANCTSSPFAGECEIAITSTVDRIRETHGLWKSVLSRSALLQSLGSLLSTATNKIIVDVEDMGDISEAESQQLASFCSRIATLEDLFLPEQEPGNDVEVLPLTAVYCSSWLKFQYLANILDSSLVDIKYLWTEGELKLEFGAGEVIDLIEALFADSDHRRRAILEIRRSAAS